MNQTELKWHDSLRKGRKHCSKETSWMIYIFFFSRNVLNFSDADTIILKSFYLSFATDLNFNQSKFC